MSVPEGFKLVPIEPTEDMIVAFAEAWYMKARCIDDCEMEDAYAAMLDAAPAPAVVQAEVSDAYMLAVTIRTAQGWNIDGGPVPILYTDTINEQQVCRDDVFLCKTEHLARPDAQGKLDTERLDWLDKQGCAYGFEDMHEGNRWMIDGPFVNLRAAIDAARGAK